MAAKNNLARLYFHFRLVSLNHGLSYRDFSRFIRLFMFFLYLITCQQDIRFEIMMLIKPLYQLILGQLLH